jgi:glycosyltransferase involved in cell wall biosynthesis
MQAPMVEPEWLAGGSMNPLVFIAWKDLHHPHAGGAERMHHEISLRLVQDGFHVTHLVPGFPGAEPETDIEGVRVLRVGHGMHAFLQLRKEFRKRFAPERPFLVDVFNCIGSHACLDQAEHACMLIHHVQGRMWFHQTRFPGMPAGIGPLLSLPGWCAERLSLRRLARRFPGPVLTVSPSTRSDLVQCGFAEDRIRLVPNGTPPPAARPSEPGEGKESTFTVLLMGTRKSKRPLHTARAFAELAAQRPGVRFWVAGRGTEEPALRRFLEKQELLAAATFHGPVTDAERDRLYQSAHVVALTSAKEGWGLVVNEANACGTPVVAYDVPGLRDSVVPEAGLRVPESPNALAQALVTLHDEALQRPDAYVQRCRTAAEHAARFSYDETYRRFREACPAL